MRIILTIAFVGLIQRVSGLFFPLNAFSQPQCFSIPDVKNGENISGSFEISGSSEDVITTLEQPVTGTQVYSTRKSADHFQYAVTTAGKYKLCFKQTSSRGRQTASFQINAGSGDFYEERFTNMATKTQTEKVGVLTKQLEYKVSDLLDQQDFALTREAIHRRTAENTNEKILYWSIAQVLVLTTIALAQLYYLRSTFEIKLIV